jgi:hypothetical protein
MISKRSKSSLCLYLTLHTPTDVRLLFERYEIVMDNLLEQGMDFTPYVTESLRTSVFTATSEQLSSLLEGFVRTQGDLRNRISPRSRHDERWEDLFRCLELDGYRIEGHNLVTIEPEIEGSSTREDDLTLELNNSELQDTSNILVLLERSAQDFRKTLPDYNGCLTNARVALESLIKSIAVARGSSVDVSWGRALSDLRTSGLISENEEKAIAGVYGFVSQGAHRPLAFSEQEMARLGRSLVVSFCYFIIKLYNQSQV